MNIPGSFAWLDDVSLLQALVAIGEDVALGLERAQRTGDLVAELDIDLGLFELESAQALGAEQLVMLLLELLLELLLLVGLFGLGQLALYRLESEDFTLLHLHLLLGLFATRRDLLQQLLAYPLGLGEMSLAVALAHLLFRLWRRRFCVGLWFVRARLFGRLCLFGLEKIVEFHFVKP